MTFESASKFRKGLVYFALRIEYLALFFRHVMVFDGLV